MIFLNLHSSTIKRKVRGTPAQRAGLYYERKVVDWFCSRFWRAAPQPELEFSSGRRKRRPDLLLFSPGCHACVVVEVKNQFVPSAEPQVKLYQRLVEKALPWCRVSSLIVCGQLSVRGGFRLLALEEVEAQMFNLSSGGLNVFVLSKRELGLERRGSNGLNVCGGVAPDVIRQPRSAWDGDGDRVGVPSLASLSRSGGASEDSRIDG